MTLTREIAAQRISGSEMSEREMHLQMMNHLDKLHTLARGMAISRKDMRWMAVANLYARNKEQVKALMLKPMGLVLPGHRG